MKNESDLPELGQGVETSVIQYEIQTSFSVK